MGDAFIELGKRLVFYISLDFEPWVAQVRFFARSNKFKKLVPHTHIYGVAFDTLHSLLSDF